MDEVNLYEAKYEAVKVMKGNGNDKKNAIA